LGRLRASDEPLRARVRHSISNFLLAVSRTGALEGTTREAAASVTCGRTMSQDDFDTAGSSAPIGITPARPAEFVIFRIQ
jgi:phage tail sheath protein FI